MLHTLLSRVADSTVPWYRRGTVLWNRSGEIENLRAAGLVLAWAYRALDKASSDIAVNREAKVTPGPVVRFADLITAKRRRHR